MSPAAQETVPRWTQAARYCWARFPESDVDRVISQMVPTTGREWAALASYLKDPGAFETCHLDQMWYNIGEAFAEFLEWNALRRPQLVNLTGYVACGVIVLFLRAGTIAAREDQVLTAVIATTWVAVLSRNDDFNKALIDALQSWPPVVSGGRNGIPAHCAVALTSRDIAQRIRALESALECVDDMETSMSAARAMIYDILRRP